MEYQPQNTYSDTADDGHGTSSGPRQSWSQSDMKHQPPVIYKKVLVCSPGLYSQASKVWKRTFYSFELALVLTVDIDRC